MSRLELRDITKRFGEQQVLAGVTLALESGEILALLGPSGSGKTTLLRILAGFESADAGAVTLGGERVDHLRPERRGFGMVFQHYALFPHLTVRGNVAFGLETQKLARPEIAARVAAALARVDLAGFERRRIDELSGGQQQRVALARALAPEPRVLLLDEPLSNLDPTLRERTRRELAERLRSIGITTVLVTHEQEEAFELGQRVALLHDGRLAQVGTPEDLYREPATRFVASFVGRGTWVPARLDGAGRAEVVELGAAATAVDVRDGIAAGAAGDLFLRPEALELVDAAGVEAIVTRVRFGGAVSWVTATLASGREVEILVGAEPPTAGAAVRVALRAGARPVLFAPGSPQ